MVHRSPPITASRPPVFILASKAPGGVTSALTYYTPLFCSNLHTLASRTPYPVKVTTSLLILAPRPHKIFIFCQFLVNNILAKLSLDLNSSIALPTCHLSLTNSFTASRMTSPLIPMASVTSLTVLCPSWVGSRPARLYICSGVKS